MSFDDCNDHIHAFGFPLPRGFEHGIGFANTGGHAQEDFELAVLLTRLLLLKASQERIGVGSAIGREYMVRSVHDARTLQQEFDLPVLGEIPHIDNPA